MVSLRMSPLRYAVQSDDVISPGNKVIIAKRRPSEIPHLEFLDFFRKVNKSVDNASKVIKTNTGTL